jgi:hypothetical protein
MLATGRVVRFRSLVLGVALACLAPSGWAQLELTCQGYGTPGVNPAVPKGTNYIVGTTMGLTSELCWLSWNATLSGTYCSDQVDDELAMLQAAGIDNIRTFGSFWGWLVDNGDYEDNVADFALLCEARGIAVVHAPFSTTFETQPMFPLPSSGDPLLTGAAMRAQILDRYEDYFDGPAGPAYATQQELDDAYEPWQMLWNSEPGNLLFAWPPANWPHDLNMLTDDYARGMARSFAAATTLDITFDLFNEPEATDEDLDDIDPHALTFMASIQASIVEEYWLQGLVAGYTVGLATTSNMDGKLIQMFDAGITQTVASFHAYDTPGEFAIRLDEAEAAVAALAAHANEPVLPLVCSEFYYRELPGITGNLSDLLCELRRAGIPGQIWGALSSNVLLAGGHYIDGFIRPWALGPCLSDVYELPWIPPATTAEAADIVAFMDW